MCILCERGRGRALEDFALELRGAGLALLEIGRRAVEAGRVQFVVVIGAEAERALVRGKLVPASSSSAAALGAFALGEPVRARGRVLESAGEPIVLDTASTGTVLEGISSAPSLQLTFLAEVSGARDVRIGPKRVSLAGRRGRRRSAARGGVLGLARGLTDTRRAGPVDVGVGGLELYEVTAVDDEGRFRRWGPCGCGCGGLGGEDDGLSDRDGEVGCVGRRSGEDSGDCCTVLERRRDVLALFGEGEVGQGASASPRRERREETSGTGGAGRRQGQACRSANCSLQLSGSVYSLYLRRGRRGSSTTAREHPRSVRA